MSLIKVIAYQCNPQGQRSSSPVVILYLSIDIVAAITEDGSVHLKTGPLLRLGDAYYTGLKFDPRAIQSLTIQAK